MPSLYLPLLIATGCVSTIAALVLWLTSLRVAPASLRYRVVGAKFVVAAHLLTVGALVLFVAMHPSPSQSATSTGASQKAVVALVVFGSAPTLVARALTRRAKRAAGK